MEIKTYTNKNSNVFKYVFWEKSYVVESVLYRYPNFNTRTVICCSVMSGCPVGCIFCGTGKTFVKNLSSEEIIFQIQYILKNRKIDIGKIKKFQIMFMSMGEPMLNWENTKQAILKLNRLYPNAELLISTIGVNDKFIKKDIIDVSKKIQNLGLQFSIHEYTNERRNLIIPYTQKMSLEQIAQYGTSWYKNIGRHPFLNYIVTSDNGDEKAAIGLLKIFDPKVFNLTLSVLCEKDQNQKNKNDKQLKLINIFRDVVGCIGFNVHIFNPQGQDDIGGGCGQLWFVQKKIKEMFKNG